MSFKTRLKNQNFWLVLTVNLIKPKIASMHAYEGVDWLGWGEWDLSPNRESWTV